MLTVGGAKVVFYLGRYALKTYRCVQESSSRAMCGLAWAETLLYRIYNLGVTDVISGAHREIAA